MKRLFIVALLMLPQSLLAASHSVTLNWTASTDVGSAYNVYRANAACASNPTFSKIASTSANVVTFTDSGVTVGVYCYQVTATLNGAESLPSNSAPAVVLPASPTSLTTVVN